MEEKAGRGKLLRVSWVAQILGVTERQVRKLVASGRLKAVRRTERRIRIPEAALTEYQEWLEEKCG
jgi:excisionase family DNA binding protein